MSPTIAESIAFMLNSDHHEFHTKAGDHIFVICERNGARCVTDTTFGPYGWRAMFPDGSALHGSLTEWHLGEPESAPAPCPCCGFSSVHDQNCPQRKEGPCP